VLGPDGADFDRLHSRTHDNEAILIAFDLQETASFLCRAGTPLDVAAKAKELGLEWQKGGTRRKPEKWPAESAEDKEPES
jgi:hypothetical protein